MKANTIELIWWLCFLIPFVFFSLYGAFCNLTRGYPTKNTKTKYEGKVTSDWEAICQSAIDKAISGDSSSRAWVTKHVFNKDKKPPPIIIDKDTPSLTDKRVIEDAVMILCGLGERKRKVEPVVKYLSTKKKYEKVEDLVKDFYKKS